MIIEINNILITKLNDLEKLPTREEFELQIVSFLKLWLNDSNYIQTKTSGSTGKPKQIRLTKSSMIKSAELTLAFFNLQQEDSILLCLPSNFIAGKMILVRSLVGKLKLSSVKPSLNPLKNRTETIDFAAMTPMQVKTVLTENPEKINLIKTLIIGGAPVDKKLEQDLKPFKTKCFSTFGMTETITHIAVKELNKNNEFLALPTVTFQKSKENRLIINAPHLPDSPILTNDIVELTSPTTFIWKGRIDNIINTGGIKVVAEELELQLIKLIPNNRFFVTSEKDNLLGEKIILIIEGETNSKLANLNFGAINKYKVPKKTYFISSFIESKNGKILKQETKDALNK